MEFVKGAAIASVDATRSTNSGVTTGPPILVSPNPRTHSILPSWIAAMLTLGTCGAPSDRAISA
jgi:hypothetical protein